MIDDPVAAMARAVATRDFLETSMNPVVVRLPKKKIKNPKEWTVMETAGTAINGSFQRYNVGDKFTDPIVVNLLLAEGIKLEPTA